MELTLRLTGFASTSIRVQLAGSGYIHGRFLERPMRSRLGFLGVWEIGALGGYHGRLAGPGGRGGEGWGCVARWVRMELTLRLTRFASTSVRVQLAGSGHIHGRFLER
jgi:hypothetical protein